MVPRVAGSIPVNRPILEKQPFRLFFIFPKMIFYPYSNFHIPMHADFLLTSYDYDLPIESIAQVPALPAHTAKMMICSPKNDGSYER